MMQTSQLQEPHKRWIEQILHIDARKSPGVLAAAHREEARHDLTQC